MSARTDGDVRPTVYTVPPHEPFVDALAGGILSGRTVPLDPGDPLALSRLTILLPTRRSCRALGLAFLRVAPGQALLLPRIRPLGDIDEDEMSIGDEDDETLPDAVSPLERRLLSIAPDPEARRDPRRRGADRGGERGSGRAACSGACQSAGRDSDRPDRPARTGHARAGGIRSPLAAGTAIPLAIIMDHWPAHPGGAGSDGPGRAPQRHAGAISSKRWEAGPSAYPVIGAGSTGSVPATRDLLAVIARLPQGAVVLPGLDTHADDETWEAIGPTHPQYALKGLLAHIGVAREAVQPWLAEERAGRQRHPCPLPIDRRRHAAGGDHHRLAGATAAGARGAPRIPPHRLCEPAGGSRRHCHHHAARVGDPRPHRRARYDGPRAGPPGRSGAPALGDRGGRFGRCAARRDAARRLSPSHRAARCRRRGACSPARRSQASAGRRRHGASGMAPLRQGHGAGDPARSAGPRRGLAACGRH